MVSLMKLYVLMASALIFAISSFIFSRNMRVSACSSIEQALRGLPEASIGGTHPLKFHEAWMILDEDQVNETDFDRTYIEDDPHLQMLIRNESGSLLTFRNYTPPLVNGTININGSGIHPVLSSFRKDVNGTTRSFFNPICHRYHFPDLSIFPTISVIIPFQNERPGLLSMTVHSILAQTPPEILEEIILIDDNGGSEEERIDVDEEELLHLQSLHPKIKWIANEKKKGCAGSRLEGIAQATAEVIVVVDSHIEMYSNTWAQHLLLPILENPRTLAMQTLDKIDDRPGHVRHNTPTGQAFGIINDSFLFGYQVGRFDSAGPNFAEHTSNRLPFQTPFAPGSLFAIRRDEFYRLGGYDAGLAVWGGENVELTMKVWRCGFDGNGPPGRVVVVPCSRVGHVYRVNIDETGRWPPPLPDYVKTQYGLNRPGNYTLRGSHANEFGRVVVRNNLRIFRVWMGKDHPATREYYRKAFGVNSTSTELLATEWRPFNEELDTDPEVARQIKIRDHNKCKSFDWFDEHVYVKLTGKHHPWHPSTALPTSCGNHNAKNCGLCPQGRGQGWCNGECIWCEYGAEEKDEIQRQNGKSFVINEKLQCVPRKKKCRAKPASLI